MNIYNNILLLLHSMAGSHGNDVEWKELDKKG